MVELCWRNQGYIPYCHPPWYVHLLHSHQAVIDTLYPLVIIRYLKPKPKQPIQLPNASRESLVLPEDPESGPVESATGHVAHSARSLPFDLSLARSSIFVEVFSYTALAFARNGTQYTVFSMLGALGAGFSPAVQSVALGLYTLRGGTESGKLFGAMSVMQSLWYVACTSTPTAHMLT